MCLAKGGPLDGKVLLAAYLWDNDVRSLFGTNNNNLYKYAPLNFLTYDENSNT